MGIPTLLSTSTASNASEVDITSNITSSYDEYMFVCTDIGPATDNVTFTFQCNVDGASGFNETMTTTFYDSYNRETAGDTSFGYRAANDQAQGTAYQHLARNVGNGADESCAGILHLFSPSSTTYVTHFQARFSSYGNDNYSRDHHIAGYINATGAIDEISFKMSSGNFDGVIQMFGIG